MSDKSWEPEHSLSLSHSQTLRLSLSHSLFLDMLNNFCFHVYAQKSLFIAENCNVVFFTTTTTTREFGVSRAGSQLKIDLIKDYITAKLFEELGTDQIEMGNKSYGEKSILYDISAFQTFVTW